MSQSCPIESLYHEELYALSPKVLVILSKNWEHVSEQDQLLLAKILGSVKLNLASVQILTRPAFDLDELQVYDPTQIIAFGSVLKSSPKYYQLLTLHGTSVIQADALHKLDEIKKKSLWNALKLMFNL